MSERCDLCSAIVDEVYGDYDYWGECNYLACTGCTYWEWMGIYQDQQEVLAMLCNPPPPPFPDPWEADTATYRGEEHD